MAEQRQNEVAQAQAEAQKVEAEAQGNAQAQLTIAEAEAKAISLKGEALRQNPNVVQMSAVEKWDGHLPTYNGGGALPFVNLSGQTSSK
jgi:regulator of protease activity HflC (stomatin/prohibitin superfamily)